MTGETATASMWNAVISNVNYSTSNVVMMGMKILRHVQLYPISYIARRISLYFSITQLLGTSTRFTFTSGVWYITDLRNSGSRRNTASHIFLLRPCRRQYVRNVRTNLTDRISPVILTARPCGVCFTVRCAKWTVAQTTRYLWRVKRRSSSITLIAARSDMESRY